jgi:triosephosphate isomerase
VETVICTPFLYLHIVKEILRKDFAVGAQIIHEKDKGAFTSEITPPMVTDFEIY